MIVHPLDEALLLKVVQMLVDGGERRESEVGADFSERGSVAVFADIVIQVVDQLLLPLGKCRHWCCSFGVGRRNNDGENPAKMQARLIAAFDYFSGIEALIGLSTTVIN